MQNTQRNIFTFLTNSVLIGAVVSEEMNLGKLLTTTITMMTKDDNDGHHVMAITHMATG